ncbi:MAG: 2-C-methyl-D-erythritol 4-phosphate cytidylyltransferase [Clostridia bacterium]|nr:2-C-methyl-D-erythritol 4-phosphate cytidylyltransferase [Clostridia bacterium]
MSDRVCAILLAGGSGTRMGTGVAKQWAEIGGCSVLCRVLRAFEGCPDIDDIVLVVRAGEEESARAETEGISKLRSVVEGGAYRAESARLGFLAIGEDVSHVAIHDVARPFITPNAISAVVREAKRTGAATAVSRIHSTVKRLEADGRIGETLDRDSLVFAETPQAFSVELYEKALSHCVLSERITDDNMLMESIGVRAVSVDVGTGNIKITTPEDLRYAEFLCQKGGLRNE